MRDDVMQVSVTRDGKVFLGSELIVPDYMKEKIQVCLENPDVERRVYIRADARARYGTIKGVLDEVRSAGILRVAFLADQRRVPSRVRRRSRVFRRTAEGGGPHRSASLYEFWPCSDPDRRADETESLAD
jgi:hypothetical protein